MPIAVGPAFAIRKRPEVVFGLDDHVERGFMTPAMAAALWVAAEARQNL